jgi:hypothetical protein
MTTLARSTALCLLIPGLVPPLAAAADPIPPERRIDWSGAGVPGGIPERTNVCATIDAATYGTGAVDAAPAILQAISGCPTSADAPAVLEIPAGDYLIGSTIDLGQKSYLTIRGAGAAATRLIPAARAFILGADSPGPLTAAVMSGATKGSTTMTLSNVDGVVVDGLLKIDRADDPALVFSVNGPGRHISQMLLVTAVAGDDVTFTPPLFWDFDDAPQLTGFSGIMARFTGIEDLLIDHEGGAEGPSILFDQCYACWARGVHSRLPLAYHTIEVNNLNCEFRDSFFDDSQTYGPNNGGMALYGTNTAWKIENNIFHRTFPGVECQNGTSGNYIGYNFGSQVEAGWEFSGVMFSDNHGPHDMMNLWEGNVGEMFQSDGYFGSASHGTLFRNHFTAQNPNKMGNFKAVSLERWSYHYNIVGNLLGGPGTAYAFYEADVDNYGFENATIFRLGYPNIGNNSFESYDGNSPPGIDAMVGGTLLRQGNYDYFHNCVWDDTAGACLEPAAAEALDLPDSLHHAARPGWWPLDKPWPAFAAERPGFDAAAPVKIPAHDCFDDLDLANGGAFDPDGCYPIVETTTSDDTGDPGETGGTGGTGETGETGPDDPTGGAASDPDTAGPDVPTAASDPGDGSGGAPSTGPDQGEDDGGCGCATGPVAPSAWLLALVGLRRRGRRKRL